MSLNIPSPKKTFFETCVTASHAGTRVDRYLAQTCPTLSRVRIKGLIEAGHLFCNGQPLCSPSTPVRENMNLSLSIPPATPTHLEGEPNIVFSILDEFFLQQPKFHLSNLEYQK